MIIFKNRIYLFLLLTIFFINCNNTDKKNTGSDLPKYELVKDWPQLPEGYVLSQVTGVGIDTKQNVFLFHRAGRHWT